MGMDLADMDPNRQAKETAKPTSWAQLNLFEDTITLHHSVEQIRVQLMKVAWPIMFNNQQLSKGSSKRH